MNRRIRSAAVVLVMSVSAVCAQDNGSEVPGAVLVPGAAVEALFRQLTEDGGQDQPLRVVDAGAFNLGVFVIRLTPGETAGPVTLMTHDDIAEVYYVLQGEGVIYHGGEIRDPAPFSTSVSGPGTGGTGAGYATGRVRPGDMFIVTPGTPHQVNIGAETEMTYLVVRVDPNKHLELQ